MNLDATDEDAPPGYVNEVPLYPPSPKEETNKQTNIVLTVYDICMKSTQTSS